MIKNITDKYGEWFYLVFRVLVGLMFLTHGTAKLFGWGGNAVDPGFTLIFLAGIVETLVGITATIGLYTRWAGALGAVTMLVAYFYAHAPNGWLPLANKGELALMYFAAFLVLMKGGGGKWSIKE